MEYRKDIDGLRAIAVMLVVGFHMFPTRLAGGFIGVDIFFVISGFLISSIIYRGIEEQTFSFVGFYIGRVKRIFPALILILLFCYVMGWFVLAANEYAQLGKHIAGGAGFVANFIFWAESGYFDNEAGLKPLLHLWSLGIEEQFYIVWPLLLLVAWKIKIDWLVVVFSLFLLSFFVSVIVVNDLAVNYYSPVTRFWELLAGAGIAKIIYNFNRSKSFCPAGLLPKIVLDLGGVYKGFISNVLSFGGALLIALGLLLISKAANYTASLLLFPVLGCALLIIAGGQAWLNYHVLSNKVLVWLGLISYPLYLWHWPLLSFSKIIEGGMPDRNVRIFLVFLSIFLAWLTYLYIEIPIRKSAGKFVFILLAIMFGVGFIGYLTFYNEGIRSRGLWVQAQDPHIEFFQYMDKKYYDCENNFLRSKALKFSGFVRCKQSKIDTPVDVAIIGDSHAEHLFIGIAESFNKKNVVYYIKGDFPVTAKDDFRAIYKEVIADEYVESVIITSYWVDKLLSNENPSKLAFLLELSVHELVKSGKKVYLLGDTPQFSFDPVKCKLVRPFSIVGRVCEEENHQYLENKKKYSVILESISKNIERVEYIDLGDVFCQASVCSMLKSDKVFFRDTHHLSIEGSQFLGGILKQKMTL